jgi:uracil-DNA glycosylase
MIWKDVLAPAMSNPKMLELKKFLKNEREKGKAIYPESKDIFRAFNILPFDQVRIVILGQDPYHRPGQADGLCFSSRGSTTPASLRVIFKEIYRDLNIQYFHEQDYESFFPSNSLENWARQGFLLLNTILTVEQGKPGSHKDLGWEVLIDAVFDGLNQKKEQVIFLLWGKYAEQFRPKISNHHLVFTAPHPAAELNGQQRETFTGCGHFSAVRDILPTLRGMNLFKSANLDMCFDKEKAKQVIQQRYPIDADRLCKYIDEELIIHIPVNKNEYWKYVRNFEKSLSTKPINNEKAEN